MPYFDIDRHQMPVHKMKPNQIDKFRYFREFLKRSERYKKLCDLVNETKRTAPFGNELIRSWCCSHPELSKPYLDWFWENIPRDERDKPYNDLMTVDDALGDLYGTFQDVFNDPFEDVVHRLKLFFEFYEVRGISSVMGNVMDIITSSHNHQRETLEMVSLRDVHNNLSRYVDATKEGDGFCHNHLQASFAINVNNAKPVILKDFKHVLDRVHKGPEGMSYKALKPFFTTGTVRVKYFQQCLDAFDAYDPSGKNQKAIERVMETNKNTDPKYDSHAATFKNRADAAVIFIEQAENGVFPQAIVKSKKKKIQNKSERKRPEYSKIEHIVHRKWAEKMMSRMGPPKAVLDAYNFKK